MNYGAIEAGGTKFVLGVGDAQGNVFHQCSLPTITPRETMTKVLAFFKQHPVEAIGVGTFGPVDLKRDSPTYGQITNTPKLAWQNFDILGTLRRELNIPVCLTTDVNAACLGEAVYGQTKKASSLYFTIGTGIGVGAINQGAFVTGLSHPEMGHMRVVPHPDDDFEGCCPFHKNCLEGLASGPAIEKRTGKKGADLPVDHPVWEFVADYLAQAVYNAALMLDPEVIILGGGVMKQTHLLPFIKEKVLAYNNGYCNLPPIDEYLQLATLADQQGIMGCLALAHQEVAEKKVLAAN